MKTIYATRKKEIAFCEDGGKHFILYDGEKFGSGEIGKVISKIPSDLALQTMMNVPDMEWVVNALEQMQDGEEKMWHEIEYVVDYSVNFGMASNDESEKIFLCMCQRDSEILIPVNTMEEIEGIEAALTGTLEKINELKKIQDKTYEEKKNYFDQFQQQNIEIGGKNGK